MNGQRYQNTASGLHTLLEEKEEPRLLQTLKQFALEPAWAGSAFGLTMGFGVGLRSAGIQYGAYWVMPFAVAMFGHGLLGTLILLIRLYQHKTDIKRTYTENEPAFQPAEVPDVVYSVGSKGKQIDRSRKPIRVKFGTEQHVFTGNDLDRLETVYIGGDPVIRRDTTNGAWGWMDKDSGLSNITTSNFGTIKQLLINKDYAEQRGQSCVWTQKGLDELLGI